MSTSVLHPTLYTPATTPVGKIIDLVNGFANRDKNAAVYRVVLCTEDSIREDDVPGALQTIRTVLAALNPDSGVTVYIRVRNPDVLAQVLDMPWVDRLRGFVVPKADPQGFPLYAEQLVGTDFAVMPILESEHMMDRGFRDSLRSVLTDLRYRSAIDCLRIGANDLMGHLGIRRDDMQFTIYDTPVGQTIFAIVNEFRGLGHFTITAPVFECHAPEFDDLLRREVRQHMMNGLFGQTVIHPRHIRIIRDLYKVPVKDLESAIGILGSDAAVSGVHGKMDERATHLKWAELIAERNRLFGDSSSSRTLTELVK